MSHWDGAAEPWAAFALERGNALASARLGEHELLLRALRELHEAIAGADSRPENKPRAARLAGFVHAMASWLHAGGIHACETEASSAVADIDEAALQILRSMAGDYGDLASDLEAP